MSRKLIEQENISETTKAERDKRTMFCHLDILSPNF